jgi:exosortase/archaeosortase family protein
VRMLWTASVLCASLAAMRTRVSWRAMALALAWVFPIVLIANTVRATMLFLIETADSPPAGYLHSLVGIVTFVIVAGLLLASETLQTRAGRGRPGRRLAFAVRP